LTFRLSYCSHVFAVLALVPAQALELSSQPVSELVQEQARERVQALVLEPAVPGAECAVHFLLSCCQKISF
jgi:hypothetical protein